MDRSLSGRATGRPRVVRSEEEQRAYEERRRTQKREWKRRQRKTANGDPVPFDGPELSLTPEEKQRLRLERRRQQKREWARRQRMKDSTGGDWAANAKRVARQDPVHTEAENASRQRGRNADNLQDRDSCCPRLLLPSPAAEHASSITWASHLAGKGNSFTQCGVPVECKSSQADFKPKSRSVGAQTQHRKNTSADSVHRKGAAAAGVSAVRRSRPKAADIALRLWEELQSRRSATDP
ncbi:uncharacterized protein LOC144145880 isoform X1 [Haemaphysalis longicornis]